MASSPAVQIEKLKAGDGVLTMPVLMAAVDKEQTHEGLCLMKQNSRKARLDCWLSFSTVTALHVWFSIVQ